MRLARAFLAAAIAFALVGCFKSSSTTTSSGDAMVYPGATFVSDQGPAGKTYATDDPYDKVVEYYTSTLHAHRFVAGSEPDSSSYRARVISLLVDTPAYQVYVEVRDAGSKRNITIAKAGP